MILTSRPPYWSDGFSTLHIFFCMNSLSPGFEFCSTLTFLIGTKFPPSYLPMVINKQRKQNLCNINWVTQEDSGSIQVKTTHLFFFHDSKALGYFSFENL